MVFYNPHLVFYDLFDNTISVEITKINTVL
jgi:hypothetical protein